MPALGGWERPAPPRPPVPPSPCPPTIHALPYPSTHNTPACQGGPPSPAASPKSNQTAKPTPKLPARPKSKQLPFWHFPASENAKKTLNYPTKLNIQTRPPRARSRYRDRARGGGPAGTMADRRGPPEGRGLLRRLHRQRMVEEAGRMDISGTYTFDAPVAVVWAKLLDPEVLAGCLPGVGSLERVEPNSYRANLDIRVGPVRSTYAAKITLHDLQEPVSFGMTLEAVGPLGFANGEALVTSRGARRHCPGHRERHCTGWRCRGEGGTALDRQRRPGHDGPDVRLPSGVRSNAGELAGLSRKTPGSAAPCYSYQPEANSSPSRRIAHVCFWALPPVSGFSMT